MEAQSSYDSKLCFKITLICTSKIIYPEVIFDEILCYVGKNKVLHSIHCILRREIEILQQDYSLEGRISCRYKRSLWGCEMVRMSHDEVQ